MIWFLDRRRKVVNKLCTKLVISVGMPFALQFLDLTLISLAAGRSKGTCFNVSQRDRG